MTKKQLWAAYTAKNPSFDGDGNVTLSAAGLRKMFNQTWDIAFEQGEDESDEDYSPPLRASGGLNSLDMFKQMFNI
jgi:hypothetical protein